MRINRRIAIHGRVVDDIHPDLRGMEIIVDRLRRIVAARPYRRDVARYLTGFRPWRRLCDDVDAELLRILCKRHRCIVALQVIGTAIDDEFRLLTVLLANAVAVRIHPARSLKDLHCFVHAVVRFLQIVIRPRKSFRKIHRRLSEAAERILDDRLAVNADIERLPDRSSHCCRPACRFRHAPAPAAY